MLMLVRMIKTNEWTVADLAKYLVSVQSTLSAEEWARLKVTSAFFREMKDEESVNGQKQSRYKAQDLYEPLDVFRKMGLPVIDWGKQSKWRSSSDEGIVTLPIYNAIFSQWALAKFLFQLGLRRYPALPALINLCASSDSEVYVHFPSVAITIERP